MTLQQKDLFTKRWRKVRAPEPRESQFQIALIDRLKLQARKDCVYFHIPNGELRDKSAAAKLKAMGLLPGVPDLEFIWPDDGRIKILFLELKRGRKGKLDDNQMAFGAFVNAIGCYFEVADSIDSAVTILTAYRILPKEPTWRA